MDYPSNVNLPSAKDQTPKQPDHVESVIDSKPKTKSNKVKSIKGTIFEQDLRDIKDGLYQDVIKPKMKDIVYNITGSIGDMIDYGIQMMIWGDARRPVSRRPGATNNNTPYNQFSSRKPVTSSPSMSATYTCDDLTFESRGDAEAVLAAMRDHLTQYPYVSVSQMYQFANATPPAYTSNNYGWDRLDGVQVRRTFDGDYCIDLPKAKPLPR